MLMHPNFDPIALSIGKLKIRWYGLMYLFGFLSAYLVAIYRGKTRGWQAAEITDLLFYAAIGVIFGGRIGYILFYQSQAIIQEPFTLLAFWLPGRSFHGGLIGVILSWWYYAKKNNRKLLSITDFIVPVVPISLGFGRLGNFINGELWGRATDLPWGMVFPQVDLISRHPSQLYELFLEGIVLAIILLWFGCKPRRSGVISGLFLILYALFRFLVEFVREPDFTHGFIAFNWLTMGQLLSIPMIILGIFLIFKR